jgi:hypothetical protein
VDQTATDKEQVAFIAKQAPPSTEFGARKRFLGQQEKQPEQSTSLRQPLQTVALSFIRQ